MKKSRSAHALLEGVVPADAFKAEVRAWAQRIGVEPRELQIRPMTHKWASCSTKGRLTFDIDLLRQPAGFRTEAIVHELLHLKVPNHAAVFKALLRAYLGQETAPDAGSLGHSSR